ncbi:MAG: hypothetical protein ACE5LU_28930, partial [Anaerolineae bacterium]
LYFDWPWLALLAPLGLIPTLMAYIRWQRRRVFMTPADLIVESGIVTTQAVSFPIHDIDTIEARRTLPGKVFDYGDVAVFSGPQTQVFEKLHPFSRFMTAYQARRQFAAGWPEPDGRFLPAPSHGLLPGPMPDEPWREPVGARSGDRPQRGVIDGRYRRLGHQVSGTGGGAIAWSTLLRLVALCVVLSVVIALMTGL